MGFSIERSLLKDFYVGQEVETEHGRGILVSIDTPFTDLYISWEKVTCTVWYGAESHYGLIYTTCLGITEIKPVK